MISTTYDNKKKLFVVKLDDNKIFSVEFVDLFVNKPDIHINGNILSLIFDEGCVITVFNNENNIEFVILKNDIFKKPIKLKLDGHNSIAKINSGINIDTSGGEFYFYVYDTEIVSTENNIIQLDNSSNEMRIVISEEIIAQEEPGLIKQLSNDAPIFSAFSLISEEYKFRVPIGQRIPEFSIALFDDDDYTIYRPLYNGIPVISTLAIDYSVTDPATDNKMGESFFYNNGVGPDTRNLYIRVRSNVDIEVGASQDSDFSVYMSPAAPVLRIIKHRTGEILFQSVLEKRPTNFKVNDISYYQASCAVNKYWGDNELLIFEVFLKMQIECYIGITFSTTLPSWVMGDPNLPILNIFSEDSAV